MILRSATAEDAAVLSEIHLRTAFMPPTHGAAENIRFVREQLLRDNQVLVAEVGGEVVGYIAYDDGWVRHLFVHPDHQGQGFGAVLFDQVMADGRERQLWTFEKNAPARAFYESRGWVLAEVTDGQDNAQKEPEVRYVSRPIPTQS